MTVSLVHDECPCVRAVATPTAARTVWGLKPHVMRPRDDCDVCGGSGEARFLVTTSPWRST